MGKRQRQPAMAMFAWMYACPIHAYIRNTYVLALLQRLCKELLMGEAMREVIGGGSEAARWRGGKRGAFEAPSATF